jgi:aryl-alcohol dehydrogenase-like predicted oxidoreductase
MGSLSPHESDQLVGQAINAGVNLIDTSDLYNVGGSERQLGEILRGRRRDIVLATKVRGRTGPGPNQVGLSRLHVMQALEDSLKRLQTDWIDLYQLHAVDPLTPLEETLSALDDAVRQGKVRYIGCSNFAAWQLMKGLAISERDRLAGFVSVQSYYSLLGRDVEHELIPAIEDQNLGLLCWSPLAGGLLSGKFDRSGSTDRNARSARLSMLPVDEEKAFDTIDTLKDIGARLNVTPAKVALAWLLSRPAVTSAIVGARRPEQLADNLAAIDLDLTEDDLKRLDDVSRVAPLYPEWAQTPFAEERFPEGRPLGETALSA